MDTGWVVLTAENDYGELEDYFVLCRRCKGGVVKLFGVGTRITRRGVVVDGRIEVEVAGMKPHIEFVAFVLITSAVVLLVYLFL